MATNQKIELVKGGKKIDDIFTPNKNSVMTADSLKPVRPLTITPPAPATQVDGLSGDVQTNLDSFNQNLTNQRTKTETNTKSSLNSYLSGLASQKGLTTLTSEAYAEKGGADDLQKELNDINAQINAEIQSERRRQEALDKNPQGLFGDALAQEKARINRESLAKQADLSVIQMAKQGQYDSAKAIADRAVAAKFEQQKLYNEALKFNYEENKDLFTTAEQREFDTLLADRNRKLDKEEATAKSVQDLAIQALQDGAPASIASQMQKAKTVEEAIAIGGQYVGALDRETQKANIAQSYASINASNAASYASALSARKSILELAQGGEPQAIADLGFDPRDLDESDNQILAYAQQYAVDGKVPTGLKDAGITFGEVSQLAKTLPQQKGSLVSAQTGVKDTSIPAAEQSDLTRLYNIIEMTSELEELDKERMKGLIGGTAGQVFGSKTLNAYLTKRKAIVDEIARMQTGAALTNDEQAFYKDYLPAARSNPLGFGTPSGSKIGEFKSVMESKLQNALANNGLVIYGYTPVKVGDKEAKVGDIIINSNNQRGRVNADGTITAI